MTKRLSRAMLAVGVGLAALNSSCETSRAAEHAPDAPPSEPEALPARTCRALPGRVPIGAMVDYSRDDYEHNTIYAFAFVTDAPCPEPGLLRLPVSRCIRIERDVLQTMWTKLREMEVHRIEMTARDGECPHCGGPWITVVWPDGKCSVGEGFETEITDATQDRYHEVARYLDSVSKRIAKGLERPAVR